MEPSDEIRRLLQEIRDVQRELLAAYREVTQRSLALQQEATERQAHFGRLYKRWMAAGALIVAGILVVIVYLLSFLP